MTTKDDIDNLIEQANEACAHQDWMRAYDLWETICRSNQNKIEYLLNLSLVLQKMKRFKDVAVVCDQILTIEPEHRTALNRKANALEKCNKPVRAIREWRKVAKASHPNPIPFYRIARIFKKNGRIKGARLSVLKVLSLRLDEDLIKLALSVLCPEKDRLLLSQLWLNDDFNPSARRPAPRKLITNLIDHQNYVEAGQLAERNRNLEPDNKTHLSVLMKIYLAAEDHAKYQKTVEAYVNRFQNDNKIRWKLIRLLEQQEHWEEAASWTFYFFLQDYQASLRYVRQLQNAQKLEDTYVALLKICEKWPEHTETWLKLIRLHIKRFPEIGSEHLIHQALNHHPDHIPFLELAAKNHWKGNKWHLAYQAYDALFQITEDITHHTMMVRSLIHADMIHEAREKIEEINNSDVPDETIFVLYAWLYKHLKDFQKLSEISKTWVDLFPETTQAWSTLFFAYQKNNQLEEASTLYKNAEALLKPNIVNTLQLAEMAYKLKRKDDVAKYCEAGIAQGATFKVAALVHKLGELGKAFSLIRDEAPLTIEDQILKDNLIETFGLLGLSTKLPEQQSNDVLLPETAIYALVEHAKTLKSQTKNNSITLVSRSLGPGGAERQVVATLSGLCNGQNAPVNLIARHSKGTASDQFYLPIVSKLPVNLIEPDPLTTFSHSDERTNKLLNLLPPSFKRQVLTHLDILLKLNSHTVHIWQDTLNITAGLAAIISKTPHIILSARTQPEAAQLGQRHLRSAYKALLDNENVSFCTNSKRGARAYSTWLSIPMERTTVIYNGLDQNKLSADQYAEDPAPPTKPKNEIIVGSVFRYVWQKNPILWVETAREIHEKHPSCKFVIVGDGELKQQTENLIEHYALTASFILPGQVKNVSPWLELMDVFLMTSSVEGLPNAALEAQSYGVPVVSTDAGGCPETFLEGLSGWSVPIDNDERQTAKQLAEKVSFCIENAQWREKAAQLAKSNISENFSITKMVADTLELYATHGCSSSVAEHSKCVE